MSRVAEIAKIVAKPGQRPALLAALTRMVEAAENEPGTLTYRFHEDASDDVTVWSYEEFSDQAARDAHGSSDAMKAIGPIVGPLLAEAPMLIKLRPIVEKKG